MKDQELNEIIERISKYKEIIVLNSFNNNAGILAMPRDLAEEFHKTIQKFVDKHNDVVVSNRHWGGGEFLR